MNLPELYPPQYGASNRNTEWPLNTGRMNLPGFLPSAVGRSTEYYPQNYPNFTLRFYLFRKPHRGNTLSLNLD